MTRLGKLWTASIAYVALAIGAGLSIMYNVLQTVAIRGALLQVWDIVTAVAMPALVVLMVELFVSRVWVGERWYVQVLRWTACAGIGGVAMRASWTHGHAWMLGHGHTADVAVAWPLAIDLLAILATALILAGRRTRGHVHGQAWTPDMSARRGGHVLGDQDTDTADTGGGHFEDTETPMSVHLSTDKAPSDGHDWTPATEPGQPWPEDMDMSKLMSWAGGHERALDIVTRGVGDEIERDLKAMSSPPPVPVMPGPLPRRTPLYGGMPDEAWELIRAWDPLRLSSADMAVLLAEYFGRDPRTIRRWRRTVLGPVSAPPASDEGR